MRSLWPDAQAFLLQFPEEMRSPIGAALGAIGEKTIVSVQRKLPGIISMTAGHVAGYMGQLFSPLIRSISEDQIASAVLGYVVGPAYIEHSHVSNFLLWCARWHQFGIPTVRLTREQFSAFAMTDVSEEQLHGLRAPWPAFAIALPDDAMPVTLSMSESELLPGSIQPSGEFSCNRIGVCQFTGEKLWEPTQDNSLPRAAPYCVFRYDVSDTMLWSGVRRIEDMRSQVVFPDAEAPGMVSLEELERRALGLGNQVVLNVLLAMHSHGVTKRSIKGGNRVAFGLRGTAEYALGTPVTIDMSPAVHAYLRGNSGRLAKARWSVRGHWRNQPCGAGRAEIKRLWIAPHWAGREGAPVITRDHIFSKIGKTGDP